MKIATKTSTALAAVMVVGLGGAIRWWTAAPPPLSANQVLGMLPRGASIHSLVRLEMDGHAPAEAAVVARIPTFPGAAQLTAEALLYRYDRLRRRFSAAYRAPNPGAVPFSADAGRLLGSREAAVFSGLDDEGLLHYRIIGLLRRRPAVVREEQLMGSLHLIEPLVVEDSAPVRRALRWDGRAWQPAEETRAIPRPRATVTWRYVVRNGQVLARTNVVHLRPRQALRVMATGGGPASIVLPDAGLDVVEAGYRQRIPGRYRIRIFTGFPPLEASYVLTVVVDP